MAGDDLLQVLIELTIIKDVANAHCGLRRKFS